MRLFGSIDAKNSEQISGWVAIRPSDAERVTLEIVVDGDVIGRVEASQHRPDVEAAGFGDGKYGFSFRFPLDVTPEQAANAQVRAIGTELYLTKGQSDVAASPASNGFTGAKAVFIFGPARSGTSVTFLALQNVLKYSGLGEGHVIPIFQRILFNYYEYVKRFVGKPGVLAGRLDVKSLEVRMFDLIRRFYREQFEGGPFVDKTPGLEALVGVPVVKQVFPDAKLVVTTRSGVEVVESYRRKFKAGFAEACLEFARCAKKIDELRETTPEALFLDQNELRATPDLAARRLADHVGQSDQAEALAKFFRESREDMHSDPTAWDNPPTIETIGWSDEERAIYVRALAEA